MRYIGYSIGGALIITVPDNENLEDNMVFCPNCKSWFHKVGHVRSFDKESLKQLIEESGFSVARIESLPIGFMASHSFLKHLWKPIHRLGYLNQRNIYAIGVK